MCARMLLAKKVYASWHRIKVSGPPAQARASSQLFEASTAIEFTDFDPARLLLFVDLAAGREGIGARWHTRKDTGVPGIQNACLNTLREGM